MIPHVSTVWAAALLWLVWVSLALLAVGAGWLLFVTPVGRHGVDN